MVQTASLVGSASLLRRSTLRVLEGLGKCIKFLGRHDNFATMLPPGIHRMVTRR